MSFKVSVRHDRIGNLDWEPPAIVQEKLDSYPEAAQQQYAQMFEECLAQLALVMAGAAFVPHLAEEALQTARSYLQMASEVNISRLER